MVRVIVDHRNAPKGKKKEVDTGGFELIHKAKKCANMPMHSCGLNLVCEGKKIKI